MSALVVALVVVIILVAAYVLYRATPSASCQSSADCVSPQVCVGGVCQAPPCSPPCAPPQVCVNGACQAPPCSPPCAPPQVCVNGACQAPACYQWAAWTPSEAGVPPWLVGAARSGYMVPVGAQEAGTGNWDLGAVVGAPSADDYGVFLNADGEPAVGPTLYGAQATGACPAPFASTADPAQALQFQGVPTCWDFSGTSNAFVPYVDGACQDWEGMGSFQLVQNTAQPAEKGRARLRA